MEDRSEHVRYNKAMHNFANTSLIIKNCISTDSVRVILQDTAMIIMQKATCEFTGARLGSISKESRDLG